METHGLDIEKTLSAYIDAALWSSTDDGGEPLDRRFDRSDIADATIDAMRAEVSQFVAENADDLLLWNGRTTVEEQAGHDLWLTRNRHGAGFWESEWTDLPGNPGDRLTRAAHILGESYLYVGDDGLIHA